MKYAIGAAVLAPLLLLVLIIPVLGGATSSPSAAAGGLNAAAVPAQFVQWVQQAGTLCPDESPALIAAQIEVESGWNPAAVSPAGAQGIAQFMPGTWPSWGTDADGNGSVSPFDPADAIVAQGRYMCAIFAQVNAALGNGRLHGSATDLALAAYNGGFGLILAAGGLPTGVAETDAYPGKIEAVEAKYQALTGGGGGTEFQAKVLAALHSALGLPYIFNAGDANGPTGGGFDCSGLALFAIARGTDGAVVLPHYTGSMMTDSRLRTVASGGLGSGGDAQMTVLQVGDLVLFNVPDDPAPWGHVGVYVGGGQMIDAPTYGIPVRQGPVYENYPWVARRLVQQ